MHQSKTWDIKSRKRNTRYTKVHRIGSRPYVSVRCIKPKFNARYVTQNS